MPYVNPDVPFAVDPQGTATCHLPLSPIISTP
jgi:hypothetical protein